MNRSILIVICDFLVLSALSLSTGVTEISPSELVQGATVSVEEAVPADKVLELLRKRAEIQKEKKSVEEQLNELKKEHEKLKQSLENRSLSLSEADKTLQATRQQMERQGKLLAKEIESHQADRQLLDQTRAKLIVTEKELTQSRKTVAEKSSELTQTRSRMNVLSQDLKKSVQQTILAEQKQAQTSALLQKVSRRFDSAQKQSSDLLSQLQEKQKELSRKEASMYALMNKLSQTDKQLALTNLTLKNAREDLVRKNQELSSAQKTIREKEIRLKQTEEQLRNSAVDYYSSSALRLDYRIRNQRALSSVDIRRTLYLPKVRIGMGEYLVSGFQSLSGLNRQTSAYSRITELEYTVGTADARLLERLKGPLYSLAENPEICLVPLTDISYNVTGGAKALEPVTFNELKQRGVDDLVLFKEEIFGGSAVNLKGRCSLQFSGAGARGVIIRNAVRDNSQVAAAEGDFVIDKLGRFVGIVTRVSADETGRREEAFCTLLPENLRIQEAVKIPLGTKERFMNAANALRQKLLTNVQKDNGVSGTR